MNKNALAMIVILLIVQLTLAGCRTARSSIKTSTKQDVVTALVSDSTGTTQKRTSDKAVATTAESVQQNVSVNFEEWMYYPSSRDTVIKAITEEGKPPYNAIKAYRKGTITVNSDKEVQRNEGRVTQVEECENSKSNTKADVKATSDIQEESTSKKKSDLLFLAGVICAMAFVGFGIYIAKKLL